MWRQKRAEWERQQERERIEKEKAEQQRIQAAKEAQKLAEQAKNAKPSEVRSAACTMFVSSAHTFLIAGQRQSRWGFVSRD